MRGWRRTLATNATVNVWDNGGVFEVTSQDIGNVYIAESDRTVTWNVAGTDQEPISTSSVNIKMSVDGGQTYPYDPVLTVFQIMEVMK